MALRDRLRACVPAPLLRAKRDLRLLMDLRRSVRTLRALGRAATGSEAYRLSTLYRGKGDFALISAIQDEGEISHLLDRLIAERAHTVCEIGSYLGGTLFMMTRVLPDDALLISVDWPGAACGLTYPESRRRFHEQFALANQRVHVVLGDSQASTTWSTVRATLGAGKLDFLLIDGDHSLAGVEADFRTYSPLVRPGGVIALHDIVPNDEEPCGVSEFWDRLKSSYHTEEIVSRDRREARRGYGFGLVRWTGA